MAQEVLQADILARGLSSLSGAGCALLEGSEAGWEAGRIFKCHDILLSIKVRVSAAFLLCIRSSVCWHKYLLIHTCKV